VSEPETDAEDAVADNDVVEILVPARGAYVATLRLIATSLGARCDLTVDDIDDLALAVDEACALLLPHAPAGSVMTVRFQLLSGSLAVRTTVQTTDASAAPDRDGFAWSVLSALASDIEVAGDDGSLSITVTKRRENASA
jgi:serine/threonine-protein kinase RsbW